MIRAGLAESLRVRFAMHLNMGRKGHVYARDILDQAGRVIGCRTKHNERAPTRYERDRIKTTTTYSLGDQDFDTLDGFLKAYEQQLRDEEWAAAGADLDQKAEA